MESESIKYSMEHNAYNMYATSLWTEAVNEIYQTNV